MNTFTLFFISLLFYGSNLYSNTPNLSLEVTCLDGLTFYTTETTCIANFVIPEPEITGGCTAEIGYAISGDFMNFSNENIEHGSYSAMIAVFDECGDTVICEVMIEVKDQTPPVATCMVGLEVALENTAPPSVEVFAQDFDHGSFDNCSDNLLLSFSPNTSDTSSIYTCNELGQQPIELWVTDETGNQSYCLTVLLVSDLNLVCFCGGELWGTIKTENNEDVEGVQVKIEEQNQVEVLVTNQNGTYYYCYDILEDLTITPYFNANPLNGVSSFDLVLLQKHILGVQILDSPYKLIAADVNNSGSITLLDLLLIRKLILGLILEFPNNPSWRFIDAIYEFPNPENPWMESFPEIMHTESGSFDFNLDFIGLKVGDLNNSAAAN